ncbi:MAG TPA: hypothetical protein VHT29_05280 [Solirubrobacteraceae bacterium]|jgi:hypothetical protein|nr:hypothetical protein [Solirubrobacteraceae bacterium]
MVANVAVVLAAIAALVTVYYARTTVREAHESRSEQASAHKEEMNHEAQLLDATTTAHEQEMAERKHALESEMWLRRLTQVARLQDLLGKAIEAARERIAIQHRPYVEPDSLDPLPIVLLQIEGALTILTTLGGPDPPEPLRNLLKDGRHGGTSLHDVARYAVNALSAIADSLEADDCFKSPSGDR